MPYGVTTAEHYLLIGTAEGERIGLLWLWIPAAPAGGSADAFVYDVEVDEGDRGKGFGRGLMLAAEDFARAHNASVIKLHVFGDNKVALQLYQRLGYEATNVNMATSLGAASG